MTSIKQKVEENYKFLINVRRHFHEHPELSSKEYETSAYIKNALDEWGIPYETAGNTSIVATVKGRREGKTIAVRGDFDALPITEKTEINYQSTNEGVMHACGHDCHAAYMLGAAKILNEWKNLIQGTVKIIFEEGEETGFGATAIVKQGLFENVDNIIGLHASQELDIGKFSVGYGKRTAHGGSAFITIRGVEGHSSVPHKTVNALLVGTQIITAVNAYAAYSFDSFDQVVLVPTVFHSGIKGNVIPGEAAIEYNIRLLDIAYVQDIFDKLSAIANNVADSYGASVEIEFRGPGPAVNNDTESVDRAIRLIEEHFGEDAVIMGRPSMAGEDFSIFQEKSPGVFIWVGAARDGIYKPLHTETTLMDEECLKYGEELLLYYIFDYLSVNEGGYNE